MSWAWKLILFLQCRFLASNKAILVHCSVLWSNNLGVLCPPWIKSGGAQAPLPPISPPLHHTKSILTHQIFWRMHLVNLSVDLLWPAEAASILGHQSSCPNSPAMKLWTAWWPSIARIWLVSWFAWAAEGCMTRYLSRIQRSDWSE